MQSSQIERTLRNMMDAEVRREIEEDERRSKQGRLAKLFRRKSPVGKVMTKTPAVATPGVPSWPKPVATKSRRSDFMVATLGIALGFGCAAFPWYIFFNQDKFGIRAMQFAGTGNQIKGSIYLGDQGERVGAPIASEEIPVMKLDLFATGTARRPPEDGPASDVSVTEQPFPEPAPAFKLVFVTKGRAMIEDDAGVWVVQAGSRLPDNSQVTRIEQRSGKWVVVTSNDRVLEQVVQ